MTSPLSLYAAWHQRLAAYLVDALILLVPNAILVALLSDADSNGELVIAPVTVLITFLVQLAYYVSFIAGRWQATPGMRLLSIYLVRLDGRILTQRDGVERFLALAIPVLPFHASFLPAMVAQNLVAFLVILWFAPILTTRIGLHDRICNMRVMIGKRDL